MTTTDAELLTLARSIAVEAGALAMRRRSEGVRVAATKSSLLDIVTDTDLEVEAFIRGRLAQERPDDGFLGEESDAAAGTSGLTWVVDPIDGTVNFLYGIPAWSVSIAVVEGAPDPNPESWTAIAGCVVNPVLGEVYTASRGGGARLGDTPISVSTPDSLEASLVATGFAYGAQQRTEQAEIVARLIGRTRDIRSAGSAALDLCSVAAGRVDAYYLRGLNPWDHAAGSLIAAEAGAVVTGIAGARAGRDLVLAAAPGIAVQFEQLLVEAGV